MSENLSSQLKSLLKGKVIILGVGNQLKSDDGIGPFIANKLMDQINATVINCGEAPENHTGIIRKGKPDIVLIIDAVDLKKEAGSIRLVSKSEISNFGLSTHNMSLRLLVDFIESEVGAKVAILGVQPENTGFGEVISEKLSLSVSKIEGILVDILGEKNKCTI